MAFKLFGMKCRFELAVLMLLIGLYLGSTLLCNCMVYEGMTPLQPAQKNTPRDNYLEGKWMSQEQFPKIHIKHFFQLLKIIKELLFHCKVMKN